MELLLKIVNNKDLITLLLTIMWFLLSVILWIASYLIWTNININPWISWLKEKVNYLKVSSRIKNIIEIKKSFIKHKLLFFIYFFIVFSFLIIIFVNLMYNECIGVIYLYIFIFYIYLFLRISWIIMKLVQYNIEIDELYQELMEMSLD